MIKLKVNGQERQADVAEDTPLLWVVREAFRTWVEAGALSPSR